MKLRKARKQVKKLTVLNVAEIAHDKAVMHQALWYIFALLEDRDREVLLRENPFIDNELNTMLFFVLGQIKEIKNNKQTQAQ